MRIGKDQGRMGRLDPSESTEECADQLNPPQACGRPRRHGISVMARRRTINLEKANNTTKPTKIAIDLRIRQVTIESMVNGASNKCINAFP
jgi:hypothetical protein